MPDQRAKDGAEDRFVPYAPREPAGYAPRRLRRPVRIALIAGATTLVIALIAGVAVVLGLVASTVAREPAPRLAPGATVPTIATSRFLPPTRAAGPPSVKQVLSNSIFATPIRASMSCDLPAWSTALAAMQTFADAGAACTRQLWNLSSERIEVFDTPDDIPPATTGCLRKPVATYWNCEVTALNYGAMVRYAGNRAGAAAQWLAMIAVDRAASELGNYREIKSLVSSVGGASTPLGLEYLRRQLAQRVCQSGVTVMRLVGHGITAADLPAAAENAEIWTVVAAENAPEAAPAVVRGWFDRGTTNPFPGTCKQAWTAPADQIP